MNNGSKYPDTDPSREHEIDLGFQRGERWAFEAAAREYFAYLVNFITQLLGDRDRALELAQEAFFLACRAHKQLDPRQGLTPWLFQIARNLAYKEFNRRKKHNAVSLEETMEKTGMQIPSAWPDPRQEIHNQDVKKRIQRAVDRLHPKYRDILILRLIMGVPSERVSKMLNMPVSTINVRTHRALKNLRALCGEEGLNEDEVF
ncbi:MAG: RNA polymerase sigma factor [bacterium]|nr:RNA polymerase sigma factor [bacterium]